MKPPSTTSQKRLRYPLGALLALLALNAFAGGYYGMAGAPNVPREWLQGSPFDNYFIPALVLFVVVGGTALIAAVAVFRNSPRARLAALFSGVVALGWIAVQLAIIGYVSPLQPAVAIAGVLIIILALKLHPHGR